MYRPLGNRLRKSIIAAGHVLAIKFASIFSDAYGLSAFELRLCLSWRVLFNLFSYSFTLCSLPVTPFSRFIFIAIYYPSKEKTRKKEREREGGKRRKESWHAIRKWGEEILYRFPSFMFSRIQVDCLNATSREGLLSKTSVNEFSMLVLAAHRSIYCMVLFGW